MVIDTAVQKGSRVKYCILKCSNTYLSDIFISNIYRFWGSGTQYFNACLRSHENQANKQKTMIVTNKEF